MIQTYPNYLDQTQVIGFGIPIGWHGSHVEIIPVTPPCRITNIPPEDRTASIPYENRTVVITCQ
jgi:hypothetical protein